MPASCLLASPPADELEPLLYVWKRGRDLVRCHDSTFGATEFNSRPDIAQRFRPFTHRRRTVPTLYGAQTVEAALSETLFHAVPTKGPDRRVRLSRLLPWQISHLVPLRDLRLADLRDRSLSKLRLTRKELIESPAGAYGQTAEWASALFESGLQPDGLIWNSRQARSDFAMVLFSRGRLAREDLDVSQSPLPMAVGEGYELALEAAEKLGITIIQ